MILIIAKGQPNNIPVVVFYTYYTWFEGVSYLYTGFQGIGKSRKFAPSTLLRVPGMRMLKLIRDLCLTTATSYVMIISHCGLFDINSVFVFVFFCFVFSKFELPVFRHFFNCDLIVTFECLVWHDARILPYKVSHIVSIHLKFATQNTHISISYIYTHIYDTWGYPQTTETDLVKFAV